MNTRTTLITDWRVRDEDALPDVPPGEEYERVITPQKHVALRQILVNDLCLVCLKIGAVEVPFELASTDGALRIYRPAHAKFDSVLSARFDAHRAAMARMPIAGDEIAVMAALDVRLTLRNNGDVSAKPRASLLAREEI